MRRRYAINADEAAALKMMARRMLEGSSLLALARELDAAGIKTKEGRPWHHSTVRVSLVNPAVAGLRVHRREIAGTGEWTPILDRAMWEEVKAVLSAPTDRPSRGRRCSTPCAITRWRRRDRSEDHRVGVMSAALASTSPMAPGVVGPIHRPMVGEAESSDARDLTSASAATS